MVRLGSLEQEELNEGEQVGCGEEESAGGLGTVIGRFTVNKGVW